MSLIDNLLLVEHAKKPQFYSLLSNPTYLHTIKNVSCGDEVTVSLFISEDIISDVGFQSSGCMLCRASTSILLINIKGKLILYFLQLTYEDLLDMLKAKEISYGRRKCAYLGFEAVRAMLTSK
jgi:NifU-like protein involved in Fe-S cluster formation